MSHPNVGAADRIARLIVALGLVGAAVFAPLDLSLRLGLFGGLAAYLLFTAIAGSCVGYHLIGRSTCRTTP